MNAENMTGNTLGQYELREILGVGGMGAVYRAYQKRLKRDVAIKILPAHLAAEPDYIERFNREAEVAAALEHPHIVPVIDYGTQDGISYIVMRLLLGGTLAERVADTDSTVQYLPTLNEVVVLMRQLGSALDYAHTQGVIHRDIKPSNVMFDPHGNAYLVDFGIAKLVDVAPHVTNTGFLMGTPAYMAPEQWRSETLTPATDQYMLAVMIYSLITGQLPFKAPTPYALMNKHLEEFPTPPQVFRPDLPLIITDILYRALAKYPEERFPTVKTFVGAFEHGILGHRWADNDLYTFNLPKRMTNAEGEPGSTITQELPSLALPRPTPPAQPNRAMWSLGAVVLVVVLALGAFWLLSTRSSKSEANTLSSTSPTSTLPLASPVEIAAEVTEAPDRAVLIAQGTLPAVMTTAINADWQPIITPFAGIDMALVPSGCFAMGSADGDPNEAPVHLQCLDAPFWIDQSEITNGQFSAADGRAIKRRASQDNAEPRTNVSWHEAQAFCETRGGRLPTEAEWEYAARGPESVLYPWGNDGLDQNTLAQATLEVDSSWVGAVHMSDNAWEWVYSVMQPYPYSVDMSLKSDRSVQDYVIRGGSTDDDGGSTRTSARASATTSSPSIGFRCLIPFSDSDSIVLATSTNTPEGSTPTATNGPSSTPSRTARPSNTPDSPLYTNVSPPTDSGSSQTQPSNTPRPTSTPTRRPTSTSTPVPPSDTPQPTNTPVPPSDTPLPTDTPIPPSNTPEPTQTSIPDTDGDGITDDQDLCPDIQGVPEENGCPPRGNEAGDTATPEGA